MNRDKIFQIVSDRHDARMDRACKMITDTDTATDARLTLDTAVRMHPGVSADPDTVADIMRLVDTYVTHIGQENVTD